ncbi:MAG: tetratricopeptide repeat protein, partial [Acidobacteria bacterium]|nr:tetratricopeptide repeat protein [Acidobacteriota bacterium]
MDLLQSKGGVRRLLSLSTVLGALILSEGSGSFRGSRPAPPPARPPATAKKVPSPPAKSSPIRREFLNFYDQSGALSLAKGEVHAYSFDLEPDDFVDIEVEQQGLDVTADIYSPGKQQHVRIDRWNGHSGQESIPLLAKVPGHYKVELTGGGKGTYRILIPRKRKATVGDRNNSKGALAYWLGTELKDKQSEQAECEFRRALESWKASGFHAGQADAAYEVAKLLRDHEAWKEALPLFQQASALYRTLGNRRQEAVILNHLGIIVEKLGARDQAFHLLEEALAIARSVPAPEV